MGKRTVIKVNTGKIAEAIDKLNEVANQRKYVIVEASIKDDFCNYQYKVTGGVGIGDKHSVTGTGIISDDMKNAFAKFNAHLAVLDDVYKHSKIEIDDIDEMHSHELSLLFEVNSIKIKNSKGYDSITLHGHKYTSHGLMKISSPEIALDNLGGYQWYNELKAAADLVREEVALYKEGKYTPVKKDEDETEGKNQASLFDGNEEEIDAELENAKVD